MEFPLDQPISFLDGVNYFSWDFMDVWSCGGGGMVG